MLVLLCYGGYWALTLCVTLCNKKYADRAATFMDACALNVVFAAASCVVYFALAGFRLSFNARTVIYSLLFGVSMCLSLLLAVYKFKLLDIAVMTVLGSSLQIIIAVFSGMLLFDEQITLYSGLSAAFMLCAIFAAFLRQKKVSAADEDETLKRRNKRAFLLGVLLTVISSLVGTFFTVLQKSFAVDEGVTDSQSFLFLTNVFILACFAVVMPIAARGRMREIPRSFVRKPIDYVFVLGSVVASNINTLISVYLLAHSPMVVYTPVINAIGLINGLLLGFCFGDRRQWAARYLLWNMLPAAFAACSIVVSALAMVQYTGGAR